GAKEWVYEKTQAPVVEDLKNVNTGSGFAEIRYSMLVKEKPKCFSFCQYKEWVYEKTQAPVVEDLKSVNTGGSGFAEIRYSMLVKEKPKCFSFCQYK
ncbi:hypothetical protein BaRGS_00024621, partial [Batillaria attramentaria]